MAKCQWPIFVGSIVLFSLVLTACAGQTGPSLVGDGPVSEGTDNDWVAVSDGVRVRLEQAELRRSYQVYYLMEYPEDTFIYLRVLLAIEGTDTPVEWGKENVFLAAGGETHAADFVRPFTVGPGYEYLSSEPIRLVYEFFFQVPVETLPLQSSHLVGERLHVALPPLSLPHLDGVESRAADEPPAVVISGQSNQAHAEGALVVGGRDNQASATFSSVAGGRLNQVGLAYGVIGGGRENRVDGFFSAITGGYGNQALAREVSIAGGSRNTAEGRYSSIGGGLRNTSNASSTTICGGSYNQVLSLYSTVCGGTRNLVAGDAGVVAGGAGNESIGRHSAVLGGLDNRAEGDYSVALAGYKNRAQGDYAIVLAGSGNVAAADYSLALGREAQVRPSHNGALLLADSSDSVFTSQSADEFAVRATGGVRLVTAIDRTGEPIASVSLAPGSGTWSVQSGAASKRAWRSVDPTQILTQLQKLELGTWHYAAEPSHIRHLGPTAQDFHAAFGLGSTDTNIDTVDADGVALAGIQALAANQQALSVQMAALEDRVAQMEGQEWAGRESRAVSAADWFNPIGFPGRVLLLLLGLTVGFIGGYRSRPHLGTT